MAQSPLTFYIIADIISLVSGLVSLFGQITISIRPCVNT